MVLLCVPNIWMFEILICSWQYLCWKNHGLNCLLNWKVAQQHYFNCFISYNCIVSIIFLYFQLHLLEESWRELFILSLAQWEIPLEASALLDCAGKGILQLQETEDGEPMESVHTTISQLREAVTRCRQLQLDRTEYTCLKAIILFKPGE